MSVNFTVHVRLDGRHFIVGFDHDGEPHSIKERRSKGLPILGFCDVTYWHVSHGIPKRDTSIRGRVLAEARTKMRAEDRAERATP